MPRQETLSIRSARSLTVKSKRSVALGGLIPAHPKVQPTDKVRPDRIYALTVADYKEFPKYNKIWKEIFKLR
jgi:hypothetical protein